MQCVPGMQLVEASDVLNILESTAAKTSKRVRNTAPKSKERKKETRFGDDNFNDNVLMETGWLNLISLMHCGTVVPSSVIMLIIVYGNQQLEEDKSLKSR